MANEKMSAEEIDDFLADIMNDKGSGSGNRLNKLSMTVPTNKGTVMFVPIAAASDGKFYKKIEDVIEIKQYTDLNDKVDECWHRLLPKSCYKNLSDEASKVYDEIVRRFDMLYDSGAFGFNLERSALVRRRTYTMFYGYVLSHVNEQGQPVKDSAGKPALLYYSTYKAMNSLASAIDAKKLTSNGSVAWVPRYFNKLPKGHQGAIVIKCEGGKGGYTITTSFASNNEDNPYLVPADLDLTESFEKCQDFLDDFMGWQGDKDKGYYNHDLWEEMYYYLGTFLTEDGSAVKPEFIKEPPAEDEDEEEQKPAPDPLG